MGFKSLVTVFRDAALDADHVNAAIGFAARNDAHLRVLATGLEQVLPDTFYGGAPTAVLQTSMNEAMEAAQKAESDVTTVLEKSGISYDVASVIAQIGALGTIISRFVSLADLVIMPKPYGGPRSNEDVALTEAALFAARTPVLILPHGVTEVPAPRKIVIGWDMSREALTAIRAALPLLTEADEVNVVLVDPPVHGPDRADPGLPLSEMLDRHGCSVEVSILSKTMPRVSDVIERHVTDIGADMVVMGAYGHSRFREAILGGTTRNMLEQARVPVFMAH